MSKVKGRFDGARFVVLAELTRVENAMVAADRGDFKIEVERAAFRVERVFKGSVAKGDVFQVDSGLTACGRGVREEQWVPFDPDRPARRAAPPRRWLIYYTPLPELPGQRAPVFEIDDSPRTRPATRAVYDLEILGKYAQRWRAAAR